MVLRTANTESRPSFPHSLDSEPEIADISEEGSIRTLLVRGITEYAETAPAYADDRPPNNRLCAAEEETMALSDTVKHQVDAVLRAYCEKRVPPHVRHQVRMSYDFRANTVTLYEDRVGFRDPSQWTHMPMAQFRHDPKSGAWTLYCADRNDRWHKYEPCEPSRRFETLLEEVDRDPTGIFFG